MKKFKCSLDDIELEADFNNSGIRVSQIFPKTEVFEERKIYKGMLHINKKSQICFKNIYEFSSKILRNYELSLYDFTFILDNEVIEYLEGLLIMNILMGD